MDKDVKKIAEILFENDVNITNNKMTLEDAERLYPEDVEDLYYKPAKAILKAGYILPSSEMKLITDEEVDQYCANKTDCPYDKKERDRLCRDCQHCTQEAQLLACKKAHAGMIKELIDAYEGMLDGMGLGRDNFKASDWQNVQALKAKYGG